MPATTVKHQNGNAPAQAQSELGRERVTDIQRLRILTAMAEVACEHGAANVTVAHVVERAGVSRRTFYELFGDREDCFLAAFDEALACASRRVLDAYKPEAKWNERIRSALIAFLSFLEEDHFMGRVLVVESLGAGPSAVQRRKLALAPVIAAIEQGSNQAKRTTQPPPLTAEAVVGGALAVLHARLCEQSFAGAREPADAMLELAGPLMGMIVLPYLGAAAASREAARPAPKSSTSKPKPSAAQLNELHIRLTYRTVRVLTALASNPGSSNRRVADAAGIADQGQMSKLLSRLQQLGLIENTSAGSAARGEPNSWTLTSKGWQVQGALAQQGVP